MLSHSICQRAYNPGADFTYAYRWHKSTNKLSHDITRSVWSGSVFKSDHRCDANWIFSDWCVLDFDDGTTIDEAVENLFCDYLHLIGTTKSHTDAHHKFRVAIPWAKRITCPNVYRGNIDAIVARYDSDPQCRSLQHAFAPCRAIVHVNRDPDAYRMEIDESLRREPPPPWDGTAVPLTRTTICYLMGKPIVSGSRDRTVFGIAKDLIKSGMNDKSVFENLARLDVRPRFSDEYINKKIIAARKNLGGGRG